MSSSRVGQESTLLSSTSKTKQDKNKKPKKVDKSEKCENAIESDISVDENISYDPKLDEVSNFENLKKHFEKLLDKKVFLVKTELKGEINALHQVIKNKDEALGKLHQELGELQKSYSFLSDETSQLKGNINLNEVAIEGISKKHNEIVDKASDLEDRSRRNNIVFYGFPEQNSRINERENCEGKVVNFLKSKGFFEHEYTIEIDRAHRLGKWRNDIENKPRPIIVRFTFYKDKEQIMSQGRLFKDSDVNASEDFSKMTLEIHRQLYRHAKEAKENFNRNEGQNKAIKYFNITYRRVRLTYTSKKNDMEAPTFTRTFSLQHILSNKNWFVPPNRQT